LIPTRKLESISICPKSLQNSRSKRLVPINPIKLVFFPKSIYFYPNEYYFSKANQKAIIKEEKILQFTC